MQDTRPGIDLSAISAAVAADIKTRFDHQVDPTPIEPSQRGNRHHCTLAINQDFGVFTMIITSAHVALSAEACEDGSIWVLCSLNYEHVGGGRNGSNIGTWWVTTDGKIVNFRAS